MGDYRALKVWQAAHKLALAVYLTTRHFPHEELYALSVQMRRAAVSVAANLAEGCGRDSDREIARYARISLGSASELEYYVLIASELRYIAESDRHLLQAQVAEVKLMLAGLARALAASPRRMSSPAEHAERSD